MISFPSSSSSAGARPACAIAMSGGVGGQRRSRGNPNSAPADSARSREGKGLNECDDRAAWASGARRTLRASSSSCALRCSSRDLNAPLMVIDARRGYTPCDGRATEFLAPREARALLSADRRDASTRDRDERSRQSASCRTARGFFGSLRRHRDARGGGRDADRVRARGPVRRSRRRGPPPPRRRARRRSSATRARSDARRGRDGIARGRRRSLFSSSRGSCGASRRRRRRRRRRRPLASSSSSSSSSPSSSPLEGDDAPRYLVVVDAGSSGSRAHVFSVRDAVDLRRASKRMPRVKAEGVMRVVPGPLLVRGRPRVRGRVAAPAVRLCANARPGGRARGHAAHASRHGRRPRAVDEEPARVAARPRVVRRRPARAIVVPVLAALRVRVAREQGGAVRVGRRELRGRDARGGGRPKHLGVLELGGASLQARSIFTLVPI